MVVSSVALFPGTCIPLWLTAGRRAGTFLRPVFGLAENGQLSGGKLTSLVSINLCWLTKLGSLWDHRFQFHVQAAIKIIYDL